MQYSSAFEYINTSGIDVGIASAGWYVENPADLSASQWSVQILTGAVLGNTNYLHKGLLSSGVEIYYYNRTRLRFIFGYNVAPVTPATMYLTLGNHAVDDQYWGFKVVTTAAGASVYGVAYSASAVVGEQTVLLYTDVAGDIPMVRGEAVLVPGLGINYYLTTGYDPSDLSTDGKPYPLGQGKIQNPIPPNTQIGTTTDTLFNLYVRADDNAIVGLQASFCEFTTELQIAL
jgi:hypothetical protein